MHADARLTVGCCYLLFQLWGEDNITQVNATANRVVGPQYIDVTIQDGSSNAIRELCPLVSWCRDTA